MYTLGIAKNYRVWYGRKIQDMKMIAFSFQNRFQNPLYSAEDKYAVCTSHKIGPNVVVEIYHNCQNLCRFIYCCNWKLASHTTHKKKDAEEVAR